MALGQYLKDTQAELRHVAWPTRTQTIVFTVLVAIISIFTAAYLGLFDYVFTTALTNYLSALPAGSVESTGGTSAPALPGVDVTISTSTQ
jgi:preprotein translocase SecE subunit